MKKNLSPLSRKKKRYLEWSCAAFAVVLLYLFFQYFGITCPIKHITGISCPGCGMTRAWLALLHLDIQKAFYYHPLFILPPIVLLLFLLRSKINAKTYQLCLYLAIALFIIVYLYRIITGGNDIVVFEPQNNIIAKLIMQN